MGAFFWEGLFPALRRDQIHGELPRVADDLAADAVADVGLLEKDISAILLIGQDASDRRDRPLGAAGHIGDLLRFQPVFDHPKAGSAQILVIDRTNHICLLLDDFRLAVLAFFIGVQPVIEYDEELIRTHIERAYTGAVLASQEETK